MRNPKVNFKVLTIVLIGLLALTIYSFSAPSLAETTEILITNTNGEELHLTGIEKEKLLSTILNEPLEEANDRIKTPFNNTIEFKRDDKKIMTLKAADPKIISGGPAQVMIGSKLYVVPIDFYEVLQELAEKHNFNLETF